MKNLLDIRLFINWGRNTEYLVAWYNRNDQDNGSKLDIGLRTLTLNYALD
jgi:hypothetical protein